MVDLVIIGGGPAGLAAACKAWESGLRDILILERDKELGGILNQCITMALVCTALASSSPARSTPDALLRCSRTPA